MRVSARGREAVRDYVVPAVHPNNVDGVSGSGCRAIDRDLRKLIDAEPALQTGSDSLSTAPSPIATTSEFTAAIPLKMSMIPLSGRVIARPDTKATSPPAMMVSSAPKASASFAVSFRFRNAFILRVLHRAEGAALLRACCADHDRVAAVRPHVPCRSESMSVLKLNLPRASRGRATQHDSLLGCAHAACGFVASQGRRISFGRIAALSTSV
jgi:hypothetical protein